MHGGRKNTIIRDKTCRGLSSGENYKLLSELRRNGSGNCSIIVQIRINFLFYIILINFTFLKTLLICSRNKNVLGATMYFGQRFVQIQMIKKCEISVYVTDEFLAFDIFVHKIIGFRLIFLIYSAYDAANHGALNTLLLANSLLLLLLWRNPLSKSAKHCQMLPMVGFGLNGWKVPAWIVWKCHFVATRCNSYIPDTWLELEWKFLPHPGYSPDMTPPNYRVTWVTRGLQSWRRAKKVGGWIAAKPM